VLLELAAQFLGVGAFGFAARAKQFVVHRVLVAALPQRARLCVDHGHLFGLQPFHAVAHQMHNPAHLLAGQRRVRLEGDHHAGGRLCACVGERRVVAWRDMHPRALHRLQVPNGVRQFLLQRDAQRGLLHRLRHAEGGFFEPCVAGRARFGQAFGREFQSRFLGARFGHFHDAAAARGAHGDILLAQGLHHRRRVGRRQPRIQRRVGRRACPEAQRDKQHK
jgi:hypothetical protein